MSIEDPTEDEGRRSVEGAVPRAFSVLEALARAGSPMRLTALANELGIQKSTVHRILSTLMALDYVSQDRATGCYRASLKLWEIGAGILAEHPVKRVGAEFLRKLQRETGETASLLVRAGDDVLYLEKLVSSRSSRIATRTGSRVPVVLTAGGKAMLAHDREARAVAERCAARIQDPFDVPGFLRELESVRTRGYALSSFTSGVLSVGAAIVSADGEVFGALSVSAPRERLTKIGQARIVELTLSACDEMAEAIGRS